MRYRHNLARIIARIRHYNSSSSSSSNRLIDLHKLVWDFPRHNLEFPNYRHLLG